MNSYGNITDNFMAGENGAKLANKKGELQAIADSSDGRKVKEMLESSGSIEKALANGDMDAVKSAITGILKTDSGARLARQLNDLLK